MTKGKRLPGKWGKKPTMNEMSREQKSDSERARRGSMMQETRRKVLGVHG